MPWESSTGARPAPQSITHRGTTMQWQTIIAAIGDIADLVSAATALILLIINHRAGGTPPSGGRPSDPDSSIVTGMVREPCPSR